MKNKIKETILEKRDALSKKDIAKKSTKIKERLLNVEQYEKSKTIMFFVSFKNEVDIHELIRQALKEKVVIIPKVTNKQIEPSVIIDFENLVEGKLGVLEPIEAMNIAYKNIDVVLVPGIAFDLQGNRIGYGSGYYDKFLKKVPKAIKIGLAFDFQIVDKIPNEEHDVSVDFIVTEERVVDCKKNSN